MAELVATITQPQATDSSLLPGWTVAHVLAHLAGNAESMVRRVNAARRGETIEHYIGGAAGRAADIETGARRPIDELITDVVESASRLDQAFADIAEHEWGTHVHTVADGTTPVVDLPIGRWWEVEVHLADLGIGSTPADWSPALVQRMLARLIRGLPARTDQNQLAAWLLGRADAPALRPWR